MDSKSFNPAGYHALKGEEAELITKVAAFVKQYFQDPKFDASHDFNHVLRVTAIAIKILEQEQRRTQRQDLTPYDPQTVILGALLHDIDDRKYRVNGSQDCPLVQQELVRLGLDASQAAKIQILVDGVSYSSEKKNPQRVRDLLITVPELAIVQDADRLDATGAVGVGRCFAYGAAKTNRDLANTMEHFDDKLFKLEGMMKTETGRQLGREYTARLRQFQSWWQEEIDFASSLPE